MKKLTWKKVLGIIVVAVIVLYAAYMAVPRRVSMLIPNIRQAEGISVHHDEWEKETYQAYTFSGEDMNALIDYLDQFIFYPVQPFGSDYRMYHGKVYHFAVYPAEGSPWSFEISDHGEVGIDIIYGFSPLRTGSYQIQREGIQVLPPELEEMLRSYPVGKAASD